VVLSLPTPPRSEQSSVLVDEGQVERIGLLLGDRFRDADPTPAAWDEPKFWNVEGSATERCQYLAVGNALNFRFWTWSDGELVPSVGLVQGESLRGSMYMWRRMRVALDQGELPLEADALARVSEDDLRRVFVDDDGRMPLQPALSDRVENLRDLGRRLGEEWNGQFHNVVVAANGSLQAFAELSATFRAFDDPVRKLTMVNAIMLAGSGLVEFDQDPFPGIDYHLIKQALRQGLVVPDRALARKLAQAEFLDESESLELRMATLDALVQVANLAQISTAVLDNLYWTNKRICSEREPSCAICPFGDQCLKRTEFALPMELTRYY
jgi:hypothetical protein